MLLMMQIFYWNSAQKRKFCMAIFRIRITYRWATNISFQKTYYSLNVMPFRAVPQSPNKIHLAEA